MANAKVSISAASMSTANGSSTGIVTVPTLNGSTGQRAANRAELPSCGAWPKVLKRNNVPTVHGAAI